jgi:hypothetical protein
MTFLKRYCQFLDELEKISEEHDELTDTDVRERLHEVINYYFIWEKPMAPDFPKRFGMFSAEGDKKIFNVARAFIEEGVRLANTEVIKIGEQRNSAIENPKAQTSTGNSYDLFLGSSDNALPPEKPTSDEFYKYEDSGQITLSNKAPLDLSLLIIEFEGQKIQPNYYVEADMYRYEIPSVVTIAVKGETLETVRNNANKALADSISLLKKIG